MVQILPEVPSFGTTIARNLGAGLSQGLGTAADFATKLGLENYKKKLRTDLINRIENPTTLKFDGSNFSEQMGADFNNELVDLEKDLGRELTPQEIEKAWPAYQKFMGSKNQETEIDPFEKAKQYAAADESDLARIETEKGKLSEKRAHEIEKMNEPLLNELHDKLESYEQTGMRFNRLENLFSKELEDKFPASFAVGMFTKDGELKPTFSSLISPEAQEAVKLVADELSGAKNTFGARVTNFDLQAYMKRLPTLLNTAEGRRKVLRDLRIMNDLNRMESSGILDVMDRHNGKISYSNARDIFRKEFAPQKKKIAEEFANPGSHAIDFPQFYKGKSIKDTETGQIFKSNGKEWIPQ